jgi:hypothetical protein
MIACGLKNPMFPVRLLFLALATILLGGSGNVGSQAQPERFWLAGRYDGNRIIVYFDAVKFNGTVPPNGQKLPYPVVNGFFEQVELPSNYVTQFQNRPNAEHFQVGDEYDLIVGNDGIVPITLTTLVGFESDEQVGNDSYIGALATVKNSDYLLYSKGYYAVRHHQEPAIGPLPRPGVNPTFASLLDAPARFDTQTAIASLLTERMKMTATAAEQRQAAMVSPAFEVQTFRLSGGALRYYARAEWKVSANPEAKSIYALGAWITSRPSLQIVAVEKRTSSYDFQSELPRLLNVLDLGGGRTGLVVGIQGEDSRALELVEYRDGADLGHMHRFQWIGEGE